MLGWLYLQIGWLQARVSSVCPTQLLPVKHVLCRRSIPLPHDTEQVVQLPQALHLGPKQSKCHTTQNDPVQPPDNSEKPVLFCAGQACLLSVVNVVLDAQKLN